MNGKEKIAKAFADAEAEGRSALIMFVTGGFPNLESTVPLLKAVAEAGSRARTRG